MGKSNELEELRKEAMRRYFTEPVFRAQVRMAADALQLLHVLPDADPLAETHRCVSAAIVALHVAQVAQAELDRAPHMPEGLHRWLDEERVRPEQLEEGSGGA